MKKILVLAILAASALFGALGVITLVDEYMNVGRMRETPAVRPHEEEPLVMEEGVIPFKGGEAILRAARGGALQSPLRRGDPGDLQLGKTLYFTYCAQCHGRYHDGNGPVGQSFAPLPTDLRTDKVQSQSEGTLFKTISYGIPNGRQPPLATTIAILDRWRIVAYLKSLGTRD